MSTTDRWAWAEVDLLALSENVKALVKQAGRAELWATVKANGYGHGAVEVALAALASGARGLCVALADEAHELRQAKITAPILIVSEQPETQHESPQLFITKRLLQVMPPRLRNLVLSVGFI